MLPDHSCDGLRRDARAQLTGVDAVGGIEVPGIGQGIKSLSHIGQQSMVFQSGSLIGCGQIMGHLVIVPALGHQLGTAFLVSPGGEQNGGRPVCPDLPAELLYAGKEALGGGDVTVAHLLKHHIVPLLLLERRLGLTAQPGVGIRVFRQPRPAPGCGGSPPPQVRSAQHLGYIIGEDKAVTQHEDPHGAAPYSFISLLLTVIIHGSAERNKARKLDGLSDFATQDSKIKLRPCTAAANGWS